MQHRKVLCLALILFTGSAAAQDLAGNGVESGVESMHKTNHFLADNAQSEWQGKSELWLDPLGNETLESEAALTIHADGIDYSWQYQGNDHAGRLRLTETGAIWKDSWHQPDAVELRQLPDNKGIFSAEYAYSAPPGEDWHWRIQLSQRPDHTLVLQMTNITPWGEEGRAVRMVFTQSAAAQDG